LDDACAWNMGNRSEARQLFEKAKASFIGETTIEKLKTGLVFLKRASALGYSDADEWLGGRI